MPSGSASGTLRVEWQCDRYARVRSGPSGSATGTSGYAQARVAVQVTLPSGVERTVAVRSGSSGSATGMLRGSLAAHVGVCSRS